MRRILNRMGRSRSGQPQENSRRTTVTLLTETDGRATFWTVDQNNQITATSEEPKSGVIISFSEADYRMSVERNTSTKKAQNLLAREYGERMRVVNLAKLHGAVYATSVGRLFQSKISMISGMQILADLLRREGKTAGPLLVGFSIGDQSAPLLVLYTLDASGGIGAIQVNPRADDVGIALKAYTRRHRAALVGTDELRDESIVLFDLKELLSGVAAARPYPIEGEIFGFPERLAMRLAAGAAAAVFGAAAAWTGFQFYEVHALKQQIEAEKQRMVTANQRIEQLAQDHFEKFIDIGSADIVGAIRHAQAIYEPAGRVILEPNRSVVKITSVLPLANVGEREAAIKAAAAANAPEGCTKQSITSTATVNEIQVNYVCPQPNSDLAGLYGGRP